MTKHLEGKVAIVTGSGQGIGKGIAVYLAREGAKVITNNRKPGSGTIRHHKKEDMPEEDWNQMITLAGDAESTANLIKGEGGEAVPFYGDVSDWATAETMIDFAVNTYGRIDIVVNNAAGMGSGSIVACNKENWDNLTLPKINGTFNTMHFAVPHMIKQGFGRIINASSEAWLGMPDNPAYCTANAAVVGLTWAAAKELWRHGITVNCYCPQGASPAHAVEYNAMVRNVKKITGYDPDPKTLKVVEENHGDPVGIGPAIAFLSTEDASYISGAVFSIYASGIVKYFADPKVVSEIKKAEGEKLFTFDELKDAFRNKLLGPDYISPASIRMW
jgi:3-oxoacyl-[acyl-carrier protein] reductase